MKFRHLTDLLCATYSTQLLQLRSYFAFFFFFLKVTVLTFMPLVDLHCHVFWRHFSNMDTCHFQSGNKDQTVSLCLCPGSRAALQCEWPPAVQQTSFQKLLKKKTKQGFWWFCRNLSCQAAGEWTRTNVGLVSPVVATVTPHSPPPPPQSHRVSCATSCVHFSFQIPL